MNTGMARSVAAVLAAALLLPACNGADGIEPPDSPSPSPTPAATGAPEPDTESLDGRAATELYVTWRQTVYALPPTQPRAVDVDSAGHGIAAPGSQASSWIKQELELARERGVIVRGGIDAESLSTLTTTGKAATLAICSSADVRITDVATGDPVGGEKADDSYNRFDVTYRRIDEEWLVERAEPSDESDCVPPSIEQALASRWDVFTEAWYERDRQGGGKKLGELTKVVTDGFATTLRGLPTRDPVSDPPEFTNFELVSATRRSVTAQACRSGGLETIEWKLVTGEWRVDFAGQVGQEASPCP